MRSITVDINPELTVYFHKIRGEWVLGGDGSKYYSTKARVMQAIQGEHARVERKSKKLLEDLKYLKTLLRARNENVRKAKELLKNREVVG